METRNITYKPGIDAYLFEKQFEAFCKFVEEKSNVNFISFASHPYTEKHEGYKYDIHRAARNELVFENWKRSDIGSGNIATAVIKSIEISDNNLVPWQSRYGDKARPQQPLYEALTNSGELTTIESCLYELYYDFNDKESFTRLVGILGKKYSILAYIFFLKDRSKYLPIAPRYFDKAFSFLGADFKTNQHCSWDNYVQYLQLIGELKYLLSTELDGEVTLLDAHSFAWILSSQMEKAKKLADVQEYLDLSSTEREAIIKARKGQGRFRESLLQYWSACAVTGCTEEKLLIASHIKPWSKSNVSERLDVYNGLLLSPALDACFDSGIISFGDDGKIMISSKTDEADLAAIGIDSSMKLDNMSPNHTEYLNYHRRHIFS